MSNKPGSHSQNKLKRERWRLLREYKEITERPLIALSFFWLVLTIVDLIAGLEPFFQAITYLIWGLFILDFIAGIVIAPDKVAFLRRNWLTAVALLLPALRVFRLARVVRLIQATRLARSLSLVRLVTSLNRGMRALRLTLGRRGIGFVLLLSVFVLFAGAAGIGFFENSVALREAGVPANDQAGSGINSYGEAIWWTAMMLTTLGSDYWPRTVEGRVLTFILALYAFAIFGYVTATLASFFVGREAAEPEGSIAGSNEIAILRREISGLRGEMAALVSRLEQRAPADDVER